MITNQEIMAKSNSSIIATYARFPVAMIEGRGCKLTDADGNQYLDFLAVVHHLQNLASKRKEPEQL